MPDYHRGLSPINHVKIDANNDFIPDRLGDTTTVAGRVTVSSGVFNTGIFALQDNTAGIFVLENGTQRIKVTEGDSIRVTGIVDQRNGVTRLIHPQIEFIDTINRYVPEPVPLPGRTLESSEGKLVFLTGIITNTGFNSKGHYMLVAPDAGSDTAIYVFNSVLQRNPDLFNGYKIGESVKVTGIFTEFNSQKLHNSLYQIWPRSKEDLKQLKQTPLFYARLTSIIAGIAMLILVFNILLRFKVKRHFQKLTESEKRFADLAGTTTSAILIFQDGKFVYKNKALERMTRKSVSSLLLPQLAEEISDFVETNPKVIALNEKRHKEFHYHSGIDDDIWLDYTLGPIKWKGNDAVILTATDITARKQAQEEVKRNEKLFYQMAESAPVGIFRTLADGLTTYVNPKWSELSGMPVELANGDAWITAIHPDDRKWLMDLWHHESKQHQSSVAEYRFLHQDGRVVWVLGQATPEFNGEGQLVGYVGTITDITEHKTNEKLLRHSEEKYRYLFLNNPQIMWICERETLRFLEVNRSAIQCYGYSRKEFLNMTILDIHTSGNARKLKKIKEQGGLVSCEGKWQHILKNGEIIDVEVTSHLFEFEGKHARLVLVDDVTERLKVQEALEKSELSLNESQKIAQMGSWEYDMIDNKVYWSENCFRLFGLEPYSIEPTFEYFMSRVHPDDHYLIQDYSRIKDGSQLILELDIRIVLDDGQIKRIQNKIIPTFQRKKLVTLKGVFIDVTEKRATEQRLIVLDQAVEQSPVSVLILDATGNIEYVNPNFTNTTGYTLDEVIGKTPFFMRTNKHSDEFYDDMVNTIRAGKIWKGELLNKKKNGDVLWENVIITPIHQEPGNVTNFVALQQDITEKKKLFEELIQAKETAEESSRLKSAFLANISHEIRTPMNGILGFTELLRSTELTKQEKDEFATLIEQSGHRMLDTITKVVEISRIDTGQVQLILRRVHLNRLLNKLHRQYKKRVKLNLLTIVLDAELPDEEAILFSDEGKLESVFHYLLDNAIKFTVEGTIQFGYTVGKHTVNFYVSDTGIGMTQEQCETIFQPFVQTSISRSRKYEGMGLGLTIAKSYIEMLGGNIEVETEKDNGTTFHFKIPFNQVGEK